MNILRILGLALVAAGLVSLYLGYQAVGGLTEKVADTVTGQYSDQTRWLFMGGGAAVVVGALMASFGGRKD